MAIISFDDSAWREAAGMGVFSARTNIRKPGTVIAKGSFYVHVVKPSVKVTNNIRMVELSQSSQLTQQFVDFGLASEQNLLLSTFRYWDLLDSVNDAIEFMSTLVDNAISAFAEDSKFLKVLRESSAEDRGLRNIRT